MNLPLPRQSRWLLFALLPIILGVNLPASVAAEELYLSSFFPQETTRVVNSRGQNLPKALSQVPKNSSGNPNYDIGLAFLTAGGGKFQTGENYRAGSLLILPPNLNGDFIKLVFTKPSQPDLNARKAWYLNGKYGINYAAGNTSTGVRVQVVVSGDRIDSSDPQWTVLDNLS